MEGDLHAQTARGAQAAPGQGPRHHLSQRQRPSPDAAGPHRSLQQEMRMPARPANQPAAQTRELDADLPRRLDSAARADHQHKCSCGPGGWKLHRACWTAQEAGAPRGWARLPWGGRASHARLHPPMRHTCPRSHTETHTQLHVVKIDPDVTGSVIVRQETQRHSDTQQT